jgi:phage-related minor tail protein
LLNEAKANNVEIVADINVQQLAVLRAIYSQLGGMGLPGSTGDGAIPTDGSGATGEVRREPVIPPYQAGPRPRDEGRRVPAFAEGGVVTKPTVALIGEAGPEAIVPLRGGGGMGSVTNQATLVVDPLLSFEGRKDLLTWLLAEMDKNTKDNPYMKRMMRRGAVGGR